MCVSVTRLGDIIFSIKEFNISDLNHYIDK